MGYYTPKFNFPTVDTFSDLELMSKKMQDEIIKEVEDLTKEHLYNGDEWIADYRRLRAIAHI